MTPVSVKKVIRPPSNLFLRRPSPPENRFIIMFIKVEVTI